MLCLETDTCDILDSYVTQVLSGLIDVLIFKNIPMDNGLVYENTNNNTGKYLTGINFPDVSAFKVQALLSKFDKIRE